MDGSLKMGDFKCTCDCYETGDGESGPSLEIDPDRACPEHGEGAEPEIWAEIDAWDRRWEAAELHFAMKSSIARNPEIMDTSFHKRRANLELDAYYAHCNRNA